MYLSSGFTTEFNLIFSIILVLNFPDSSWKTGFIRIQLPLVQNDKNWGAPEFDLYNPMVNDEYPVSSNDQWSSGHWHWPTTICQVGRPVKSRCLFEYAFVKK